MAKFTDFDIAAEFAAETSRGPGEREREGFQGYQEISPDRLNVDRLRAWAEENPLKVRAAKKAWAANWLGRNDYMRDYMRRRAARKKSA